MKRLWLGVFLVLGVAVLLWWAMGRGGGGEPGARSFNLSIVAQTLYGAGPGGTVQVKQGDAVTLHLASDEPMEVFLHGYDLEVVVKPGPTDTVQFTANILGRFPLMIHSLVEDGGSHEAWKRVEILLGFIEVLPKK